MYSINRQVIVVKPKAPYIEWINLLPDMDQPIEDDELNNDCTSCLIPHFDYKEGSRNYIKKIYKQIFEVELESWTTDEQLWPQKRNYSLFQKWFVIEIHSEVIDFLETKIEKEEF